MDFLTDRIRPMYFKYLTAAFGSALISSIYGVVDMAMVGQYQGPDDTATLAVVSSVWNIIYSLGLLMEIGGSVLFSTARGESSQNEQRSNELFTAAFIGTAVLSAAAWFTVFFSTENCFYCPARKRRCCPWPDGIFFPSNLRFRVFCLFS